jgi:hypothetical protein
VSCGISYFTIKIKKMNFGAIIGLIFLIACILIIILVISKNKNSKKQILQTLFSLAEKNNSKISEHDIWNNTLIGIDKDAHKLFYVRNMGGNGISEAIDLSEIQKGRVVNSNRIVTSKESSNNVTDKIALVLTLNDSKKPDIELEFYNTNRDNLFLNGELQLTEKWAEIVNTNISGIRQRK